MPRSPAILNSQPGIGMQLFDWDSGPAAATDFNLAGPGQGGNYSDLLSLDPRVNNTHNYDFSVNINKVNMFPNPDFSGTASNIGITGSSTGTSPGFWGAYNPTQTETCGFTYNSGAGVPVGNGGAWKLSYSHNTNLKGLYVGSSTGYSGFKLKANTYYTFSAYVMTPLNVTGGYSGQYGLNFDSADVTYTISNAGGTGSQIYYTSDTSWYWINFVLLVGVTDYTGNIYFYNQYDPAGTAQVLYIGCPKLEEGQVTSGWTGAAYETGITDFVLPHPNKNIDNIADGTTRAGILITELHGSTGSYTVSQLNDGTNTRTAANVAAIISGGGILNSNVVTSASIQSGAVGTLKIASAAITTSLLAANAVTWKNLIGDTSADTTTAIVDASNKRFLHASMSTGVQAVITTGGQVNVSPSGGVTGNLPYSNNSTAFTATVTSTGNLIPNPFGNTSGVTFNNADYTLSGFSTSGVSTVEMFPTLIACCISADIMPSGTTGTIELGIGSTTAGYSLRWVASGSSGVCGVYRWVGGTNFLLGSVIGAQALFTANVYNRLRLVVDFLNEEVEAVIEQEGALLPGAYFPTSDATHFPTFGNSVPIWINAGGTSGKVQNLEINPRDCFLENAQPVIAAIDPSGSGHFFNANTVDARAIAPGAVTSTNNSAFGTSVTQNSDGSLSGFSNSGTATTTSLNLSAGSVVNFYMEFQLATATTQSLMFILGNTTSGYGLTWNSAGVVKINKWATGTATILSTIATITQDTKVHSLHITITSIGSSSTQIECSFDNQTPVSVNDGSINLITGTWPITIIDGYSGTTKIWNYSQSSSLSTYTSLPGVIQKAISAAGVLASTGPALGSSTTGGTQSYLVPAYTHSGAIVASTFHVIQDNVTAVGTPTTITLSGNAAYTSATSYIVIVFNHTTGAAVSNVTVSSGTSFSFTSVNTDVYVYVCIGT